MNRSDKTVPGLRTRLIAAAWFAAAAIIPVGFFFRGFGQFGSDFEGTWLFGLIPVISAAFCGFQLGGQIISPKGTQTGGGAVARGLLVAFSSYLVFMALFAVVLAAANFPPSQPREFINPLGVLYFFAFGLLFVGWLIAIVGGLAGWLLFVVAALFPPAEASWQSGSETTTRMANTIAVVLLFLSLSPVYLSMRTTRNVKLAEQQNHDLVNAASDGNVAEVQRLLNEGAEVDPSNESTWPALIWAARAGHNDVMKLLLDHGANPNVFETGNDNVSPLFWTVSANNIEGAKMLLLHGANVNAASTKGYTPFMTAAVDGTPAMVRLLLDYRPDLALRNERRQTALEFVRSQRDVPSLIDVPNETLRLAPATIEKARRRHDEIIELIERHQRANSIKN